MVTSPQYGYGSLIAQGVATTISAFGMAHVAKHSNAIAKAQANIARINADVMERNAQAIFRANENKVMQLTTAAGQHKARQVASMASSGFAINSKSNVELLASTDLVKEIDKNQLNSNATREAWGVRMQKASYLGEAKMAEANRRNPWEVFGTTLLSGAAQTVNNYAVMKAKGVFDTNAGKAPSKPQIIEI